jgi:branched-subunit amino acid permease
MATVYTISFSDNKSYIFPQNIFIFLLLPEWRVIMLRLYKIGHTEWLGNWLTPWKLVFLEKLTVAELGTIIVFLDIIHQ